MPIYFEIPKTSYPSFVSWHLGHRGTHKSSTKKFCGLENFFSHLIWSIVYLSFPWPRLIVMGKQNVQLARSVYLERLKTSYPSFVSCLLGHRGSHKSPMKKFCGGENFLSHLIWSTVYLSFPWPPLILKGKRSTCKVYIFWIPQNLLSIFSFMLARA